jgi:hypothetical protein
LEAWEILKNGGKVTNPDTLDYYYFVGDYIARFDSESGELITRYEMIPYGFMERDNWEAAEEPLEEAFAEKCYAVRCPKCKNLGYYFDVDFSIPETCVHCGKQFKLVGRDTVTDDFEEFCESLVDTSRGFTKFGQLDDSLKINLPELKIDTTLPKGTLYMRNDTAEGIELVFGKIHEDRLECHKKWLRDEMQKEEKNAEYHGKRGEYHDASDCLRRYCILDECLMELNKRD